MWCIATSKHAIYLKNPLNNYGKNGLIQISITQKTEDTSLEGAVIIRERIYSEVTLIVNDALVYFQTQQAVSLLVVQFQWSIQ